MRRLPGWEARLNAYLKASQSEPFAWGRNDCVAFCAGAVEAVTGERPVECNWTSEAEAETRMAEAGGLAAAVDGVLPRMPNPAFARRGDVVLVEHSGAQWVAIVGTGCWHAPHRSGIRRGRLEHVVAAWSVG